MTFTLLGFLLAVAPLVLLVLLLAGDVYPGERAILLLRKAFASDRCRSTPSTAPNDAGAGQVVRGGRLIARSLAGRSPPCRVVSD